ncbi:MAG: nicotinamide-nucleotide adenylyltransferase [Archaeoglobus sp.]|uniref:nicotinamide-nucleotide adenylyltransferase n=1 Tax=Archaeoglobus sp. TaxID=1872626 RepID=UPI001D75F2F0|nr:nicotinamide-nucleotide adenylyltransferase [Archaeoglobus sp.]MBO8179208.1 nicotinamide-nucleotide adenylyltransferase [Archaeoglobus sp.]
MRAFFVGRFQPYHLGHHEVVRNVLKKVDELIIAIGSAQESHSLENPFTAGERVLMIDRAVEEIKREMRIDKKVYIIPLEDIYRNSLWVAHVCSMVPPFDVVYTNNPLVYRLFKEAGFNVMHTKMYNRNEYHGTEIRRKMLEGEDWEKYVPKSVAEIIKEIKGIERLRDISGRDF